MQQAVMFFCANDYDRASLNDIAKALAITKGGIYHYFESKDELFHESVLYLLERLYSQMEYSLSEGSSLKELLEPIFMLEDTLKTYTLASGLDLLSDYKNLIYLLISTLKKFPDTQNIVENFYINFIDEMERLFRDAIKRGEIRSDLDPEGLAFEVASFIEGGMLISTLCGRIDGNAKGSLVFDNFWKRIKK
jgi:AcrR family transcriptional regulator